MGIAALDLNAAVDELATDATELLARIKVAVAVCNDAEKKAEGAKNEFTSRGRAVGVLLLELKRHYPKPKEFEAKLTKVCGLHRSRAYEYMALAGGRKTEAGLREEARLRKEKERQRRAKEKKEQEQAERAKPKPILKPESVTVTDEETKPKQNDAPVTKASALDEFRFAARNWIPKMSAVDKQKALKLVTELVNGRTAK
jgi:hypothetical protein